MTSPALELLLGGYLHQDCLDFYPDVWAALEAFRSDNPETAPTLARESSWALEHHGSEAEVEALFVRLGCDLLPPQEVGTYRGWLTEIRDRAAH